MLKHLLNLTTLSKALYVTADEGLALLLTLHQAESTTDEEREVLKHSILHLMVDYLSGNTTNLIKVYPTQENYVKVMSLARWVAVLPHLPRKRVVPRKCDAAGTPARRDRIYRMQKVAANVGYTNIGTLLQLASVIYRELNTNSREPLKRITF